MENPFRRSGHPQPSYKAPALPPAHWKNGSLSRVTATPPQALPRKNRGTHFVLEGEKLVVVWNLAGEGPRGLRFLQGPRIQINQDSGFSHIPLPPLPPDGLLTVLSWSPRSTLLRRPNRKEDEEGLSCRGKTHLSCLSCPAPFGVKGSRANKLYP